jgi:hypothetical protein
LWIDQENPFDDNSFNQSPPIKLEDFDGDRYDITNKNYQKETVSQAEMLGAGSDQQKSQEERKATMMEKVCPLCSIKYINIPTNPLLIFFN